MFPILKPSKNEPEISFKLQSEIMANKMKNKNNKLSDRGARRKERKKLTKDKQKLKKTLVTVNKAMKNGKIKQERPDEDKQAIQKIKPVFNQEGKMVFSKFDFAAGPMNKEKNKNSEWM